MKHKPSTTYGYSTADMALCLNTSVNNLGQLVRQQVLTRDENGLFDPRVNFPAYLKHYAEGLKSKWAADGAGRTRLTDAKARLAELKVQQEERHLVPLNRITIAYAAMVEHCRTRLLAVARKVAPRLATVRNVAEAEGLVQREIEKALLELSRLPVLGDSGADGTTSHPLV